MNIQSSFAPSAKVHRQTFQLTDLEKKQFVKLRREPFPGEAWRFWKAVAARRELDPASLITRGDYFTALPLGHNKAWCFPIPLKCVNKPVYRD